MMLFRVLCNRTWRPSPAPQPVGRGEAVVLEAALDEALPAGGIAAKYQPWSEASQSPAQVWLQKYYRYSVC